jgi:DNA polymerase-1
MRDVPIDIQTEYAAEDADITLQLKQYFEKEMDSCRTLDLYKQVELPLVNVLTAMECEGINLRYFIFRRAF